MIDPKGKGKQMKYINRKQSLIVTGNTATEFQEKLNTALAEIAEKGYKHDIQFNMAMGLCAYILYEERREVAETIADEYELKGMTFKCYECPMFRPSEDKRVRYTTCAHGVHRTAHNDLCCDWFYEQLEGGALKLNEEGSTTEKDFRSV